jgi:CBS domain-containing protein
MNDALIERRTMKASDLMTKPVHSCQPHDDLRRAAQLMWDHDCGIVPVLDLEQNVIGVITDRDVCMAAYTRGQRLRQMDVRSTMTKVVHAVREDDSLETVEAAMRCTHARRVPVLDDQRELVGLLSIHDLARAHRMSGHPGDGLEDEAVVRTIGEIIQRGIAVLRPQAKLASDLMTREVHYCRGSDGLDRVAGVMWNHGCGSVPVVGDGGRTIGMVTDRDVCMAAYTRGQPLSEIPVTVAASRGAHSVRPDTPIGVVQAVMRMHRIRRLPVLDIGGNLVGFLSLTDIVRNARAPIEEDDALGFGKVAATLESVCRRDDALLMRAASA